MRRISTPQKTPLIYTIIEVSFRQRAAAAINAAAINTAGAINIVAGAINTIAGAINTKFPYSAASAVN
ncbi:hypothetical protein ARSEF1564_003288 [Beauveria bassiana]